MARFKQKRSSARRSVGFARRARRSVGRAANNDYVRMLGAAVYGATRQKVSELIAPVTSRIPILGNFSDEALLIVASKWGKSKVKNNVAKAYLDGMLMVESASVGRQLMAGGLGSMTGSVSSEFPQTVF